MATHIDATELLNLLESSEIAVTKQIKELVYDNLNNSKEAWLVNSLVDFYIVSTSANCIQVLVNVTEPHDKHLLDKLNDVLKGSHRLHAITLLSHLVQKQPPWIHIIVKHAVLGTLLKALKTDSDVPVLMSGLLVITALLPIVPVSISHHLRDVFYVFGRIAMFGNKKSGDVPEVYMLHLKVGVYCLFQRLYGMYPCNFLSYLRTIYTREEYKKPFEEYIKPLLDWVRLHPQLVTSTPAKEMELSALRWRHKEVHDIVVECAKLSVDLIDGSREDNRCPVVQPPKFTAQPSIATHNTHKVNTPDVDSSTGIDSIVRTAQCSDPFWSPTVSCRMATPPPGSELLTPGGSLLTPQYTQTSQGTTPNLNAPKPTPSGLDKSLNSSNVSLNAGSNLKLKMPSGTSLNSQGSAPASPNKMPDVPLQAIKKIDFTIAPPEDEEEDLVQPLPLKKNLQQSESADSVASRKKFDRMISEDITTRPSSREEKSVALHNVVSLPNIIRRGSSHTDILTTVSEDPLDDDMEQQNDSLSSSSTDTPTFPEHLPDNLPMTAESVAAFMRNVNRIRFNTINITKDRQHYIVNGTPPHKRSNSCPNIELQRKLSMQEEELHMKSESHISQLSRDANIQENNDKTDTATSPVVCNECRAAATQTSLAPSSGSQSGAFISVTNTTTETTEQLYIPYAHLFPFVMPHALSSNDIDDNNLGSQLTTQNIKPPLYASYSPTELLDRQIQYGDKKHTHDLCKEPQKKATGAQMKGMSPVDESTYLNGQVLLLHSHLMFERHKRELHAKRNRRLLGKIVKTTALEEQNAAMHDQLRLQENEIQGLHVSMKLLQSEHNKQLDSKQIELVHIDKQHRNLQEDKEKLLQENGILKAKLELLIKENTAKAKEIEAGRAEIFNLQKTLQVTKEKADQAQQLQEQVSNLKHEVLVAGETHQRYGQQLTALANSCLPRSELQLLIDSLKSEIKECKHTIEQKTSLHHAARSRVMELEETLKNKELSIMEQKKCLEMTKSYHSSQIQALEDKYCSQRQIQKSLQAELVVWQDKVARLQRGVHVPMVINPQGHASDWSRDDTDSAIPSGTGICELHTPAPRSLPEQVFSFSSDQQHTPDPNPDPTPATPRSVQCETSPTVVQGTESSLGEQDITIDLAIEADQINLDA